MSDRNGLIRQIITALGGTPTSSTRNGLLQQWYDAAVAFFGRMVYAFNGTNGYALMASPWVPKGILCRYGCNFEIDTAASGSVQTIISGETAAGAHEVRVNASGDLEVLFRDTGGVSRTIIGSTLTDGQALKIEVVYSAAGVDLYENDAFVSGSSAVPELPEIESIAASLTPSQYFGGKVWKEFCTADSPMQGIDVMEGNGTDRYASLGSALTPVEFTSSQWVFTDGSGATPLFGNDSDANSSLVVNADGSITLTDSSGTSLSTSAGDIVNSQHHLVETVVEADGACEILVDGESQASSIAGTFDGLAWNIATIQRSNSAYGVGTVGFQEITDTSTSGTNTYNNDDNYEQLDSELLVAPTTVNAPWVDNLDGTYSIDGSQGGEASLFYAFFLPADLATGDIFKCIVNVTEYNAGAARIISGSDITLIPSSVGEHVLYLRKTDTNRNFNWQALVSYDGTIKPVSVKKADVILPDSTGGNDVTWVNATIDDLVSLDKTDRYYLMNEGTGNTFEDSAGSPAVDGTIQNFDESNWVNLNG